MSKLTINVGTSSNSGDGDTIRSAMIKSNSNFTDLYTQVNTALTSFPTAAQVGAVSLTDVGQNSGIATLNSTGKLTATQLPAISYSSLTGTPPAIGGLTSTASAGVVSLANGSVTVTGNLMPSADATYNIGSPTATWKEIYVSAKTIYLGSTTQLSGTSIVIAADPNSTSLSQMPTMVASNIVAVPFTYVSSGANITVRPSIQFQDTNGLNYPISFNTVTYEFSLDAQGNYGQGALVAKQVTLSNSGGTALTLTGDIVQTGNYTNTSPTTNFRYDGNVALGYNNTNTLTVNSATNFVGSVAFSGSPTIGGGNVPVVINAGGANPLTITSSTMTLNGSYGATFAGSVTITGNLVVNGTQTIINSSTLVIGDNIISLNADIPGYQAPTLNAGLSVSRGTQAAQQWLWDETHGYWTPVGANIGNVGTLSATAINVGTLTASLISGTISGTAATASALATPVTITLSGDIAGSTSFNGASNVSITSSLATTGVVLGTYTQVSVDMKGRVLAGFSPTTLAGYGITDSTPINATIDGGAY